MLYLFAQRFFGTKSSAASWSTMVDSLKETTLLGDDLGWLFAFGKALPTGEGVEYPEPSETRVSDVENKVAIDLFFCTKGRTGVGRELKPDDGEGLCASFVLSFAETLVVAGLGEIRGEFFPALKRSPMFDKACKPPTEEARLGR